MCASSAVPRCAPGGIFPSSAPKNTIGWSPTMCKRSHPAVAARVSPTNLGLLLNARQVACEFGYLTVPEFAEQTLRTLATVSEVAQISRPPIQLVRHAHLAPLAPAFVSSVDSGNSGGFAMDLQQGCLERLRQPLLQPGLAKVFWTILSHYRQS